MSSPAQGSDSIRRNAVLSLTNQLISAALTAVLTFFLVRALGPEGYGLFVLALSVGTLGTLLSDFGVSTSAARFVAEHAGDHERQFAVIGRALRLKLTFIVVVATALLGLARPISQAYGVPSLEWPLRGAAIALAGQSLLLFGTAIFAALGRVAANLRVIASESAVEVTASIALVLLGAGATGAAFGRAIGYTVGGTLTLVVLSKALDRNVLGRIPPGEGQGRRMAGYAFPVFVTTGVYTMFTQLDVLLLGALIGSGAVGTFQAAVRINSMFTYAGTSIAAGVAPRMAARERKSIAAFQAAVRYLIVGQAILLAPLVVWAHPIVFLLLGPAYDESVPVLRALTPFVFLSGLGPLLTASVTYLGRAGRRVPIAVAAVVTNAAVDVVLIPEIGPLGAAIGTDIGFLVYVPAHFWICRRELGLTLRPIAITLARTALAVTAMGLVLTLAGTGDLSPVAWILAGTGGVLAYLVTLVLTGEIEQRELREAGTWISRRLGQLKR